jgi:isocitrate dehydrogenase kinase/phosphatase
MTQLTDSRLANLGAQTIHTAFLQYRSQFWEITGRAKGRFEQADWRGARADAGERLDLYRTIIDRVVADIQELLAERRQQKLVWASMKAVYSGLIADHDDWEIAETFYNSVTRRIFDTVGVDPQIEFVSTDFETPPTQSRQPVYRVYDAASSAPPHLPDILAGYRFDAPFADLERDERLVTAELEAHLKQIGALRIVERVEMAQSPFYRGIAAYLVGRLYSGSHLIPFVLALLSTPQGIVIDKVLLTEAGTSILFSFTRSYFHLQVQRPYDLVQFLKTIMPRKKTAELYIALGFHKHGKTEFYRDLLHHLHSTNEQFRTARGQRGMVMLVFNMPNYEVVFKIIKDRFSQPKTVTRQDVLDRYRLVFRHDRAGRLVDAQTFEHLEFKRSRFTADLLADLLSAAGSSVCLEGDFVVISHAYVERRVIPLDLYIQEAHEAAAEAALLDYGQAIKDLAASNIFPGDMLLKNFGVTRHGRVVFYDYDELRLLTDCNFRKIPPAPSYEDELSDQPWFAVGENDIFPEEFPRFLGISGRLRDLFMAHHADLFTPTYWQQIQARLRAGELIHIFPYPPNILPIIES